MKIVIMAIAATWAAVATLAAGMPATAMPATAAPAAGAPPTTSAIKTDCDNFFGQRCRIALSTGVAHELF